MVNPIVLLFPEIRFPEKGMHYILVRSDLLAYNVHDPRI